MRTSPSHIRWALWNRDRGVCAVCKTDTGALREEYQALPKPTGCFLSRGDCDDPRNEFLKAHGIPWGRATTDWWDADHIVPVIEGGGECDLSNFRTLCIPCHKKATKELRERMSKRRINDAEEALKTLRFADPACLKAAKVLKRAKRSKPLPDSANAVQSLAFETDEGSVNTMRPFAFISSLPNSV